MAKKKTESPEVSGNSPDSIIRHARIELPDQDYQRLKQTASRFRISVSAYIRLAVMERIEEDERKATK